MPRETGGALLTVFRKEMLEVSRDRRTLVFMLVLPLLFIPALLQITTDFATRVAKKAATETLHYAVFGGEDLPQLAQSLGEAAALERVELGSPDEIRQAIADETIEFALVVPPAEHGASQRVVELHYDNADSASKVENRVKAVLTTVSTQVRAQRLTELGVESSAQGAVIEPVVMVERGTASVREKMGDMMGGFLPYMVIPFCFLGALYPAIDLGAGEKERGTLETLLLAPMGRTKLVLGKFLVVFTTGVVSATLSLVAIGGWIAFAGSKLGGDIGSVVQSVGLVDLTLIWTMLLPTSAMFAAVLLAISIYAKSFKEAQSFAAPFNIVAILPAVAAMLPGVKLDATTASIPVTNTALAIKELLKGSMDYGMLVVILASSTVVAGVCLAFCVRWFSRENVLFRS